MALGTRQASTAIALVALAAALAAAFAAAARQRDLADLERQADSLGVEIERGDELDRALRRAADPGERRLALARALLEAAVAAATPADTGRAGARLAAAGGLAREALATQPASAEAAGLAGAALALEYLARRDERLLTERRTWRAWLAAAEHRHPGARPAGEWAAAAELEILPALRGGERADAEERLRVAFESPTFLRLAFPRWLEVAGSLDDAAALLPDRPDGWDALIGAALRRGDLSWAARRLGAARRALAADLGRRLDAAIAAGDRRHLDEALAQVPPDRSFAPLLETALAARPPGPAGPALAAAAARQLEYALPLCALDRCPLPGAALDRLAALAGGGLPAEQAAQAALLGGRETRAATLARRSDALWSEAWGPYQLLLARRALAAGDAATARAALAAMHRAERARPAARRLARQLAGAAEPDPAASLWQPSAWQWRRGVPELELDAATPATGLFVELVRPPATPLLLVPEWDGRSLAAVVVPAGAAGFEMTVEVEPGLHLLRLARRAGEPPAIGLTRLGSAIPAPAAAPAG